MKIFLYILDSILILVGLVNLYMGLRSAFDGTYAFWIINLLVGVFAIYWGIRGIRRNMEE